MANGRVLKQGEQVFDLVDVIQDDEIEEVETERPAAARKIHNLVDEVEEETDMPTMTPELRAKIATLVSETAERIAREIVPEIAEKVIREEIDKLKKGL